MHCIFLRNPILLIYQCVEMNRWLLLHFKSASKRLQIKKSSSSCNMVKLTVNDGVLSVCLMQEYTLRIISIQIGRMRYENELQQLQQFLVHLTHWEIKENLIT